MTEPNPLETAPTVDLVAELMRRYDTCIFAGVKQGIRGKNTHECEKRWSGDRYACLGLATVTQRDVLVEISTQSQIIDDDDRT